MPVNMYVHRYIHIYIPTYIDKYTKKGQTLLFVNIHHYTLKVQNLSLLIKLSYF